MKITILILLSVALGWFGHGTVQDAIGRIDDWRDRGFWAFVALCGIAAVLGLR